MDEIGRDAQRAGAARRVRRGGPARRLHFVPSPNISFCTAAAYAGEPGIGRYDIDFCRSSTSLPARRTDSRIGVLPVPS